jgi:glutathione S-transferase
MGPATSSAGAASPRGPPPNKALQLTAKGRAAIGLWYPLAPSSGAPLRLGGGPCRQLSARSVGRHDAIPDRIEKKTAVAEARDTDLPAAQGGVNVLYGLSCSYFTGKLEAYFRTKGVPYRFEEMSRAEFRLCAGKTGIVQLPCVETPDGTWLTDTTAIIKLFEASDTAPRVRPDDSATAFCSLLLEDLFDEWFWRPALYYRWAFDEDATLMSSQIARTLLRDVRLPLFLRRRFILHRQRIVYLKKDGVTKETAPAIEALYLETLRELNAILARRSFLFGERPCEADFGLFGPFFRHFFCDPTPGGLMRRQAPHVAHWVTRLWKTRPADLEGMAALGRLPDDLGFFFEMVANDYLPYLDTNARAVSTGATSVHYEAEGVAWRIPSAPYRVECLNELKRQFAELDGGAASRVADRLSPDAIALLKGPTTALEVRTNRQGHRGRLGRPAAVFD